MDLTEVRESHQDATRGLDGAEHAKIFTREEVISRGLDFFSGAKRNGVFAELMYEFLTEGQGQW